MSAGVYTADEKTRAEGDETNQCLQGNLSTGGLQVFVMSMPCHIVSLSTCSLAGCRSDGANESSGERYEGLRPSVCTLLLLGALLGWVSLPRLTPQIDF